MTDKERLDDAYDRIDIDTDEILLALCDACYGERVERCMKSIWDSTVTMHQIATVALKENAKLRELVTRMYRLMDESCAVQHPYAPEPIQYDTLLDVHKRLRKLGVEVEE